MVNASLRWRKVANQAVKSRLRKQCGLFVGCLIGLELTATKGWVFLISEIMFINPHNVLGTYFSSVLDLPIMSQLFLSNYIKHR